MARRWMKRLIWTVAGLLGLALFVRVFVVGLYYVDSGSMEPTVHGAPKGGEYLAVRYGGARDLERFDLVVLLPGGGESEARIKRLVGLPGESLILRGGNLWIDGQLLAPNEPRPPLVPCFDDGLLDVVAVLHAEGYSPTHLAAELKDPMNPGNRFVSYRQLSEFTIESDRELHCNLDGEPVLRKRFKFGVLPRWMRVAY